MLLIKCPKCQASYRLAESLYRRKAAGYGVVITCRRCKTQIHVDEGSLPPPAGTADQTAPETPDDDVIAGTAADADQEPVTPNRAVRVSGTPTPSLTTANIGLPPADGSEPNEDTADAAITALPNVAPKPAAPPRPLGIPRPGAAAPRAGAAAPRRQGTLLGIAPPAHALTPALPTVKPKAPPAPAADDNWKPKLVALSPGLLGVQTATHGAPHGATHGAPPGAKAPPAPPHAHHAPPPPPPPPVPEEEAAPDSVVPLSAGSVELIDSKPPDSVVPLDSADYSTAPETAPPTPPPVPPLDDDEKTIVRHPVEQTPLAVRAKRMPQPPPARPASAEANAADAKSEDKPRRRQASGDLTDDFLSSDVSFDARASAPALAPPDAGALTRAPVSNRPAAAQTVNTPSTKAPTSKSATAEKKGSGRGVAILLVMAAFGGAGYVLQHRAMRADTVKPEPNAALDAPPADTAPPVTAPADTAPPAPTDTVASAPPEPSATAPEAPAVAATAPATGTATPTAPAPAVASTSTPKPAKTSERAAAAPAETAEKVATTATAKPTATAAPTSTAAIEPRGAAGTEPFDVAAARAALDATAAQASGCRKEGDPSGVAVVTITFSQTGRVTTANISGPPFQATPTGGCIASTMRKTRVPAFAGEMVTVRKTITVQ